MNSLFVTLSERADGTTVSILLVSAVTVQASNSASVISLVKYDIHSNRTVCEPGLSSLVVNVRLRASR